MKIKKHKFLIIGDPGLTTYVKTNYDFNLDDEVHYVPNGIADDVGGSVFNIAVPLRMWRQVVTVIGNIGQNDNVSPLIVQFAEAHKLKYKFFKNYKHPIRSTILIRKDGDKLIFHDPKGANEVTIFPSEIEKYIQHADLIHLCVFNWARETAKILKGSGKIVGTDIHTNFDIYGYHRDFIEASNIVFFSAKGLNDVPSVMNKILDMGPEIVISTAGENGCYLMTKETRNFIHFTAFTPEKELKDTTGAGDAFAAGFYFAYMQGYPIEKCIDIAQIVALNNSYHIGSINPISLSELSSYIK